MNIEQLTKLQQELNAANDRVKVLEAEIKQYVLALNKDLS